MNPGHIGPPGPAPARHMAWVPAGEFLMGSGDFYPEEAPAHRVHVDGFWMDEHPVTNAEFRRFVAATGHVTAAERAPRAADFPDTDPAVLVPGSLVFRMTAGPTDLRDYRNWWSWVPGACWRRPEGPGTDLGGRDRHPVVHVAPEDAEAYAAWAGKALPTEAEWERAARGGLEGRAFAWGDEFAPHGRVLANTWRGDFPWRSAKPGGRWGTTPVGTYPANGFGLHDVTGNVWEWTSDYFLPRHGEPEERPCCVPRNPRRDRPDGSYAVGEPGEHIPRRVIKGGSHLCAACYCLRYRPAARQGEAVDTSTGHIGFRCIVRHRAPGLPGPGGPRSSA